MSSPEPNDLAFSRVLEGDLLPVFSRVFDGDLLVPGALSRLSADRVLEVSAGFEPVTLLFNQPPIPENLTAVNTRQQSYATEAVFQFRLIRCWPTPHYVTVIANPPLIVAKVKRLLAAN